MRKLRLTLGTLLAYSVLIGAGCSGGCANNVASNQGNDLNRMTTAEVTIGKQRFEVWVAATEREREYGLMFVQADQMRPLDDGRQRGMLFVFPDQRTRGFWMANTYIPLDIAFANSDGLIVKTHTMTPLDRSTYSSGKPARVALEVNAGLFAETGIEEGDTIQIPDDVLNSAS